MLTVALSCAPSQDKASTEEHLAAVRRVDAVYQTAYEQLDAAVLERVLAPDYRLRQPEQGSEKTKDEWIAEVAELKTVFPALQLLVEDVAIEVDNDLATVTGKRSFRWQQGEADGAYGEYFENTWQLRGGEWRLIGSTLTSLP